MAIDSDIDEGLASRESVNRNCENDRNPSVYADFKRLFRPALRGYGLPVKRVGGECAGFA